jgi:hypothetical protein
VSVARSTTASKGGAGFFMVLPQDDNTPVAVMRLPPTDQAG